MNRTRVQILLIGALTLVGAASLGAQTQTETQKPTRPEPTLTGSGPNGATIRCRDGSHPAPNAAASACDDKGGVGLRYPMRAVPNPVVTAPAAAAAATPPAAVRAPEPPLRPWSERAAEVREAERAAMPPRDATLHCNDGTFIARDTSAARCATHGGVRTRLAPNTQPIVLRPRGS